MKAILLLSFIFLTSSIAISQTIPYVSEDEWGRLIEALENEDWATAEKLSSKALERVPVDSSETYMPAVFRYMNLLTISALMNEGIYSKDEAIKLVKPYEGHFMVLAGHPISTGFCHNCVTLAEDRPNTLSINSTNKKATNIYTFEYITLTEGITENEIKQLEGKIGTCMGVLDSVTVEGFSFKRFTLMLNNGELFIE